MAKQIVFDYNGKTFTLEFTRKTIGDMEKSGFIASDIEKKPMTILPALFAGAFLAHHRYEKPAVIEEIYSKMTDKPRLIEALGEMYNEPLESLLDEPESEQGNVNWTSNW